MKTYGDLPRGTLYGDFTFRGPLWIWLGNGKEIRLNPVFGVKPKLAKTGVLEKASFQFEEIKFLPVEFLESFDVEF